MAQAYQPGVDIRGVKPQIFRFELPGSPPEFDTDIDQDALLSEGIEQTVVVHRFSLLCLCLEPIVTCEKGALPGLVIADRQGGASGGPVGILQCFTVWVKYRDCPCIQYRADLECLHWVRCFSR